MRTVRSKALSMTLDKLRKNQTARIIGFGGDDPELIIRLREIGFAEGDHVQALHFGLFGRNPMSLRLNGALIALRRGEASAVVITPENHNV